MDSRGLYGNVFADSSCCFAGWSANGDVRELEVAVFGVSVDDRGDGESFSCPRAASNDGYTAGEGLFDGAFLVGVKGHL